ncbi:Os10g0130500, partial [Oryza sativa Japonica Group]
FSTIFSFCRRCSYQCRSLDRKIAFLDPAVVNFNNQLSKEKEIDDYLFNALVKQNGYDHILLPYLSHHHWILFVINIDDSKICVYDSLRKGTDNYQTIMNALNRAYVKYRRSKRTYGRCAIDATSFRIFENQYIYRQPALTNLCGMYVMWYMLCFVESGHLLPRNAEKLGLETSEMLPHVFTALTD